MADEGFFEAYTGLEKLVPLVREIGWSHNLAILERCKDPLEREFYLRMTRKFGWTKKVLIHQIDNQSYEKSLLGQTNFDQALTPELRDQAKLAVKDEYSFDFLELGEEHGERELERALIARIEDFLRAMGGLFAFMGSQFRLEVDGKYTGRKADTATHQRIVALRRAGQTIERTAELAGCSVSQVKRIWALHVPRHRVTHRPGCDRGGAGSGLTESSAV